MRISAEQRDQQRREQVRRNALPENYELRVSADLLAELERMRQQHCGPFGAIVAPIRRDNGFVSPEAFQAFFDSFYERVTALLDEEGFLLIELPRRFRRVAWR